MDSGAPFAEEQEAAMLAVLADELPNEPYLVALQAVDAQDAIFCAFYMEASRSN